MAKNKNFAVVYKYLLLRKQYIRKLDGITVLEGINDRYKKIVIFIAIFAYLRFLKMHHYFFNKDTKNTIDNIEGIKISSMTQKTINYCQLLIQKQSKSAKNAIKRFINDIYLDRHIIGEESKKGNSKAKKLIIQFLNKYEP